MLRVVLFFLFVLSNLHLLGQGKVSDIKKQLQKASNYDRYLLYLDLARHYRFSDPALAIKYCDSAQVIGKSIHTVDIAMASIARAEAYRNYGKWTNSSMATDSAIKHAVFFKDSIQLGYAFNHRAKLNLDVGKVTDAFNDLNKAEAIFSSRNHEEGLAAVFVTYSDFYVLQDDLEKAIESLNTSITIGQKQKKAYWQRNHFSALLNMSRLKLDVGDTVKAWDYLRQAEALRLEGSEDHTINAESILQKIKLLMAANKLDGLDALLKQGGKSIDYRAPKLDYEYRLTEVKYFFQKGDAKRAAMFVDILLYPGSEIKDMRLLTETYRLASKIHEQLGNKSEYVKYASLYQQYTDSLNHLDLVRRIERLNYQVELEKKDKELTRIKLRDSEQRSRIRLQILTIIVGVVAFLIIAVALFFQRKATQKLNQANKTLAEQNLAMKDQDEALQKKMATTNKLNKLLASMNNEKDSLMNILVHDLKSPLLRIVSLLGILKDSIHDKLDEEQRKNFTQIERVTKGSLQLIQDVLNVNAMEVSIELYYRTFDLRELIEDRISFIADRAREKKIEIRFDKGEDRFPVTLDEQYLGRVIDNLISNAVKFSPPETRVRIRYGVRGGEWFVSVSDQGPGFTDRDKLNLYEKFRTLTARPTGGETSNGIGLAIVKLLVTRMGGVIHLETAPGAGATFTVYFVS